MFDYRKYGRRRTEEERRSRHAREHPGTPLPPRGTGGGTGRLARGLQPYSDEGRATRHYSRYGTGTLPTRGTGLGSFSSSSIEAIFGRMFGK